MPKDLFIYKAQISYHDSGVMNIAPSENSILVACIWAFLAIYIALLFNNSTMQNTSDLHLMALIFFYCFFKIFVCLFCGSGVGLGL